jgi:glycerol-3-phosphate acyltransferase PlsY
MILVLMPNVTLIVFAVWAVTVFLTRYVSLASIIAAVLVPSLAFTFSYSWQFVLFSLIAAIFVVIRHKENIKRLIAGQESKIKSGSMEQFKGGTK